MNRILKIRDLAPNVKEYVVDAPAVAKNAKSGQFIILICDEGGERVPFTICDSDKAAGTVTILVQDVGYSTHMLGKKKVGDFIHDFAGPLGNPTDLSAYENICLIGGGIGSAVIFPQSKFLHATGKGCDVILGARNKELIMYEDEFKANCDDLYIMTDDGSYGDKGLVTNKLEELILGGKKYDCVFAVGPMIMMKFVCLLTKKYNIPTVISMNSIMVDGTGMCGCCRITCGGETKYACVDGPEFDGHLVDFDEAMTRNRMYAEQEKECFLRGTRNE